MPKKKVAEEKIKSKLRIKIRAYDSKITDKSCREIVEIALRYGTKIIGPIPLPTEIRKFTVNRSSFVHKDSREQFEMRIHKRLIDVLNPPSQVIGSLRDLTLPTGVDIEMKSL